MSDINEMWLKKYKLAKEYYEENNNLLIPKRYVINGIQLGQWIANQRKEMKNNSLSNEKMVLLNSIGMVWKVERVDNILKEKKTISQEDKWLKMFEFAKRYYNENSNLLISQNYETNDGIKLGSWINTQRASYRKGTLSQEKIELLENIEMDWNPSNTQWKEVYNLACEYYKKNNSLFIPIDYEIKGVKLGLWISNQRQAYKNNKLSKERIDLLNQIFMCWEDVKECCTWTDEFVFFIFYLKSKEGQIIKLSDLDDNELKMFSFIFDEISKNKKGYYKDYAYKQNFINEIEKLLKFMEIKFF